MNHITFIAIIHFVYRQSVSLLIKQYKKAFVRQLVDNALSKFEIQEGKLDFLVSQQR